MEEIWKDIKEYEGIYQVSNLGVTKPHVCSVLKGKRKTTKGYIFKYLNEGDNK